MDEKRFDAIARGLASPAQRRGVLRGLGAGTLVALLGPRFGDEAEAAAVHCPSASCSATCTNAVDPHGGSCNCAQTLDGNPVCVVPVCKAACNKNSDCPTGNVCSQTPRKCCSKPTNKRGRCVLKCKPGKPPAPMSAGETHWVETAG